MNKRSCIIIDDEPAAIRLLQRHVDKVEVLTLSSTFTKPLEALSFLQSNQIDVIFLDVQMPQLTGIQLSKLIGANTQIIFTTAYSEFAIDSYDVDCVDYLLKPIAFERLYKAVLKLQPPSASESKPEGDKTEYLFIKTDGKLKFRKVYLEDILFIEGLKNYVSIQLKDDQIITNSTLKHILASLPKDLFLQVHKSFIISKDKISKVDGDSLWVAKYHIPIGNTYKKNFFAYINSRQL